MYAAAEYGIPHFQEIRGNHAFYEIFMSRADDSFIDWGLRNEYDDEGNEIKPRPKGDEEDEERFAAWREGRTGFPYVSLSTSTSSDRIRWIDACMRQLKHEGWIHHLARHSVACFITRGQCYISWERGMEVFDGECG